MGVIPQFLTLEQTLGTGMAGGFMDEMMLMNWRYVEGALPSLASMTL